MTIYDRILRGSKKNPPGWKQGSERSPPRKVRKTTLAPSALAGRNSTLEKGAGARSDAVSGLIGLGAGMMLDRDRYTNHNLLHNFKKNLKLLTLF